MKHQPNAGMRKNPNSIINANHLNSSNQIFTHSYPYLHLVKIIQIPFSNYHRDLCIRIVFHYRQIESIKLAEIEKEYLGDQFTGTLFRLDYDYGSSINLYVICRTIGI